MRIELDINTILEAVDPVDLLRLTLGAAPEILAGLQPAVTVGEAKKLREDLKRVNALLREQCEDHDTLKDSIRLDRDVAIRALRKHLPGFEAKVLGSHPEEATLLQLFFSVLREAEALGEAECEDLTPSGSWGTHIPVFKHGTLPTSWLGVQEVADLAGPVSPWQVYLAIDEGILAALKEQNAKGSASWRIMFDDAAHERLLTWAAERKNRRPG